MTSRELCLSTLEFRNTTGSAPRQLWTLPWATERYPDELRAIETDYPPDITGAPAVLLEPVATRGDQFGIGEYIDEWGCAFENVQRGVIGEVKRPLIASDDYSDAGNVMFPRGLLTFDRAAVNRFCAGTDKFVLAGACPRPFERMQFLRTSEELYCDLADPQPGFLRFLSKLHDFYCELLEAWADTDVDALQFMDDWGAQRSLLIDPKLWDRLFAPLYRDYIAIAKSHGKKAFMHSDGNTLAILPRLAEMGLDAVNAQIFCIGVGKLRDLRGAITFWGELDRQWILPHGTLSDVERAVELVRETLWDNGGCIAQCEFGPGGKPENVRKMFGTWDGFAR